MAITQKLTPEDISWYKQQVIFARQKLLDVVQKYSIPDAHTLEPKKPWERQCDVNDACYFYINEIMSTILRLELKYGCDKITGSIELNPPSLRQDRHSKLAFDCLEPRLQMGYGFRKVA